MLNSDSTPTKPAAAAPATVDSPPALTLQASTVHSSQNCGVRTALRVDTSAVVTSRLAATRTGSNPCGRQPRGGTRTLATPNIMIRKYAAPRVRNSVTSAPPEATDAESPGSNHGS